MKIRRRVEKIEDQLKVKTEPITVKMIMFGGELPPPREENGYRMVFEMYDHQKHGCASSTDASV